jgi:ketosteroid isomerase-like protein
MLGVMPDSLEAFIRRGYEKAWNDGDLEALLDMAADDIVFIPSGTFPDQELEYRGRDQVRRLVETLRAPFEQLDIHVEHVLELGDRILVLFHFRARGRQGLVLNARSGHVGQMRDGLITRINAYPDWETAAAAVGQRLEEL